MIKREYETKTHLVTNRVMTVEKRYCDICGKEITDHHWQINTHHHDKKDYTIETYNEYDACSAECLHRIFNEYLEKSNKKMNTEYISVHHHRYAEVEGEINYNEK